jgi:hypothetical protein
MYQEELRQKADCLEEAARILRSQIPHRNHIWMKSIVDRKLGKDIMDFVADVQRFENTGRTRDTTWADGAGKVAKRRVRNTMGYQRQKP